jgi:hypothetical protein
MVTSRRMKWAEHVAGMEVRRNALLVESHQERYTKETKT